MKRSLLIIPLLAAFTLLIAATFEEAQNHYEQQQYEDTIDIMKDLLKKDKNNIEYNRLMANSYLALMQEPNPNMIKMIGHLKKTKKYFEKVTELDPNDIESRVNLANSYFFPPGIAGGNKKKARKYLAEIKKLSLKRGLKVELDFLAYEKEYDQAEKLCRSYMDQFPEDTEIYYTLGMLYQQQEKYNKAFSTFEQHVQKDETAYKSMYQIGRTAVFSESELELGVEYLGKYLEHEPSDNEPGLDSTYWRLGMLYELQDKKDLAKQAFESGLKINPENNDCKKELKKYS